MYRPGVRREQARVQARSPFGGSGGDVACVEATQSAGTARPEYASDESFSGQGKAASDTCHPARNASCATGAFSVTRPNNSRSSSYWLYSRRPWRRILLYKAQHLTVSDIVMRQYSKEQPTAVELFCGVGGLSLGSIHSGFKLIGAVDLDQTALDADRVNFPKVPVAKLDLRTATAHNLRCGLDLPKTPIDLLIGGPPCQGFSVGGVGAKRDPRNQGVFSFARLIAQLRPRYFVMENVRGFLALKHTALRRRFCKAVKDAGYVIRLPIRALNAANFGVPQRRIRAFVLGHAEGEVAPDYPSPNEFMTPTVWDAIGDLTLLDHYCSDFDCDHYSGPFGPSSDFATALRKRLSGRVVKRLSGCLRSRHSSAVIARFRATKPGEQEDVSRYYRLAWSGISPTLRAGTGPDHGSHTAPRPIHPVRARCITVREAARLHTFPDWFAFHGTKWHGFRQIGNSVPPYLAKAVLSMIHDALMQSD